MSVVKLILRDVPEEFETERLSSRAPLFGDGAQVLDPIHEAIDDWQPRIPWAQTLSLDEAEERVRVERLKFLATENLLLLHFLKRTSAFVGSSGLLRIDREVPKFESGYWVRRQFGRQGCISEAVYGITLFAPDSLGKSRRDRSR